MLERYPAKYRDKSGEVLTTIENDGHQLRMVVRGVEFRGNDFDSFEPTCSPEATKVAALTLCHGDLSYCEIECEIPIPLAGLDVAEGVLHVHLDLGGPTPTGQRDREALQLDLRAGNQRILSAGKSGSFEGELLDIQKQLPEGAFMKACINCAFSDYSPYGSPMFGGMACFRNNKEGYRLVKDKYDLFEILDMAEVVQETYLCPEFERRLPDTGYRG